MRAALDHLHGLGIATVKLDATPEGRPLYASLGFVPEVDLERWQGVARPAADTPADGLHPATLPSLLAIDRAAYGIDRSRLVERLVADAAGEPLAAPARDADPAGYALARRGRMATYIGPVIAATPAIGLALLDGWIERLAGDEVSLDFHRGGSLNADAIAARGLTKRRILTRMRHGVYHEAGTARTIGASSGPEFG